MEGTFCGYHSKAINWWREFVGAARGSMEGPIQGGVAMVALAATLTEVEGGTALLSHGANAFHCMYHTATAHSAGPTRGHPSSRAVSCQHVHGR